MVELIISSHLTGKICRDWSEARMLLLRPLKRKERTLAKENKIPRYYLQAMNNVQAKEFLQEFDHFWDKVVKPFDREDVFWRNTISSKMQEWERSTAYLALTLFTLSQQQHENSEAIIVICSNIEEEDVWEAWGKKNGWKIIRNKTYLPRLIRRFIQETRNIVKFLYFVSACFYKKWYTPTYSIGAHNTDAGFLIVSLFYENAINQGNYQDPFFGHLHRQIIADNKNIWYLASPIGDYRNSALKAAKFKEVPLILPLAIISWGTLINLVIRLLRRRLNINRSVFQVCDFSALLSWNARRLDFFFNFDAEIFYIAVKELCKIINIEKLILIYEGNVFERACIKAFRKFSEGIIIGYSHAVVFPLNLKIRLTSNEKKKRPEPDLLISTGPETKNLLVEIGNRDPSKILTGCSLRSIPAVATSITTSQNSVILAAFDGVWSAVSVLNWLMEQAHVLRDYKVILRGHPNVPIEKLLEQCIGDLPDNFYISDGNLKDDIESSFCVLYRQTSVGLQALMNGVPVIHLAINAPLPCDPIEKLKNGKWTVNNIDQLLNAIKEIKALSIENYDQLMQEAKKYALEYFSEPNERNIDLFLKN